MIVRTHVDLGRDEDDTDLYTVRVLWDEMARRSRRLGDRYLVAPHWTVHVFVRPRGAWAPVTCEAAAAARRVGTDVWRELTASQARADEIRGGEAQSTYSLTTGQLGPVDAWRGWWPAAGEIAALAAVLRRELPSRPPPPARANPIESAPTSRNQVPGLFAWLARTGRLARGARNFDLGAGRFDAGTAYLRARGVASAPFDPYNRTAAENRRALAGCGRFDTVTVANVLNVIPDDGERADVVALAARCLAPAGVAYFSVYEGDRGGRWTRTRDGWQGNRRLAAYLPEVRRVFPRAARVGAAIVAPAGRGP